MPFDAMDTVDLIGELENYLEQVRPPEHLRSKVDIQYQLEGQSFILAEVRPLWDNPSEYRSYGYAKATYVKSKKIWKLFWMRASGNWDPYETEKPLASLDDVLRTVIEDKYHCFLR